MFFFQQRIQNLSNYIIGGGRDSKNIFLSNILGNFFQKLKQNSTHPVKMFLILARECDGKLMQIIVMFLRNFITVHLGTALSFFVSFPTHNDWMRLPLL